MLTGNFWELAHKPSMGICLWTPLWDLHSPCFGPVTKFL